MFRSLAMGAAMLLLAAAVPAVLILSYGILLSAVALAQDGGTTVTVPWGNLLSSLLLSLQETITVALLAVLTAVIARLPGWVTSIIGTARVDQLLTRAIDYAIATTAGAVQGEALSVDVGNAVVAKALRYALEHGPGWLIGWMGGAEMVAEKIIARVPVTASGALRPPA